MCGRPAVQKQRWRTEKATSSGEAREKQGRVVREQREGARAEREREKEEKI